MRFGVNPTWKFRTNQYTSKVAILRQNAGNLASVKTTLLRIGGYRCNFR